MKHKRQFGVTTYKAIKRNQCEKAVAFVRNYNVPFVLQEEISESKQALNDYFTMANVLSKSTMVPQTYQGNPSKHE